MKRLIFTLTFLISLISFSQQGCYINEFSYWVYDYYQTIGIDEGGNVVDQLGTVEFECFDIYCDLTSGSYEIEVAYCPGIGIDENKIKDNSQFFIDILGRKYNSYDDIPKGVVFITNDGKMIKI